MSVWRGSGLAGSCLFALALALAMPMAGCAGPIETRSGLTGAGLPANASVALAVSHEQNGPLMDEVHRAVAEQLALQGHPVAEDGAARVVVGFAEHPASLEVLSAKGEVLSAAKRRKALQNCADRKFRLTLVAEGLAVADPSRAWAEEYHCKGAPGASIGPLAAQAVAALAGKGTMKTLRSGQD